MKTLVSPHGHTWNISQRMTKPTKWHIRPAKTQVSLGFRPVWSESSLCAQWVAKDPSFLHANTLIRLGGCPGWSVFAWRTCHFVGFVMRWLIWKWLLSHVPTVSIQLYSQIRVVDGFYNMIIAQWTTCLFALFIFKLACSLVYIFILSFFLFYFVYNCLCVYSTSADPDGLGNQRRTRLDAAFCGVWSGSTLVFRPRIWTRQKG